MPSAGTAGGHETVLVVEDEETVRNVTVRVLADAGYTVVAAHEGREALEIMRGGHGIDLVVTDVVMPVLGGGDLAERLAIERPDLPVLFMSGYTGAELLERGLAGADERFLQKPFAPESLLRKVRTLLDSRSAVGSDVMADDGPERAPEPEEP